MTSAAVRGTIYESPNEPPPCPNPHLTSPSRNLAADDTEIIIEWSADLLNWTPLVAIYDGFENGSGSLRRVRWSANVSGFPGGFARVRVNFEIN